MASGYTQRRVEVSAQVAMASTGDKMTFTPGCPVNIVRWGVIADALIDVGAGFTIKADWRPTAGSDSSRSDGTCGDITVTSDINQGQGAYTEECATPDAGLPAMFLVDPGEQIVFEVTDAADTSGTGMIFVEYELLPFVGDRNATADGFSNRIDNMTKNE